MVSLLRKLMRHRVPDESDHGRTNGTLSRADEAIQYMESVAQIGHDDTKELRKEQRAIRIANRTRVNLIHDRLYVAARGEQ